MQYSFKKISTVQGCDILLTNAQKKKQSLERRRRKLGESIDTFRKRMDNMNKESADVRISIDAFTTAYHALPEGKHKAGMLVRIKRLEVRQVRLELKAFTYNVASLLVKEMKYNRLDSQVAALEEYIAAVRYLRMTLGKMALRVNRGAVSTPKPAGKTAFLHFGNNETQYGNTGEPAVIDLCGINFQKEQNHEDYFHYRRLHRAG